MTRQELLAHIAALQQAYPSVQIDLRPSLSRRGYRVDISVRVTVPVYVDPGAERAEVLEQGIDDLLEMTSLTMRVEIQRELTALRARNGMSEQEALRFEGEMIEVIGPPPEPVESLWERLERS